jgi:putative ABC transport system permease protein
MALSGILKNYRARLRVRVVLVQELLAVLGLAVGVALLFGSQVAGTSLNHSVSRLYRDVVGNMQLQLQARGPRGFPEALLSEVRQIPGVAEAQPVLDEQAEVIGPHGRESVELLGAPPSFAHHLRELPGHLTAEQVAHQQELGLPGPVAAEIGASGSLQPVEIQVGTHVSSTLVGAVLQERNIGDLVHSPVAIAPIEYAQELSGTPGLITRVFVRTAPGREAQVRAALIRLAAGRLNVEPADFDATLFATAAASTNQSAGLFAAISALVGFMFAFDAMLITTASRRELIAELRENGATRSRTIQTLLFDALILGVLGSALGLLLGDLASIVLFGANPGYLSFAFPVGVQRVVTWQSVAISVGAGMLAAAVGVLVPLRGELARPLRRPPISGPPTRPASHAPSSGASPHGAMSAAPAAQAPSSGARSPWFLGTVAGGIACLAGTTIILVLDPAAAIAGSATLVVALLLLLAPLFDIMITGFDRVQRTLYSAATRQALIELRNPATRTRSLAIAATGAIAVFGSVAIQGAHGNLQKGLDQTAGHLNRVADVWVSVAGATNTLATTPFATTSAARLEKLPGVRSLAIYRGSFLNIGDRRVWVVAPPSSSPTPIPGGQVLSGNFALAQARLRRSGWVVLSRAIANEHHLHIGDSLTLPSPRPTRFRIAALSTNIGWSPGAVIMSSADYARAWESSEASAYNIDLRPGVSPAQGAAEIRRALGPHSGLIVETARQRELRWGAGSRQGLSRLSQIALLVLLAAALAMAGAIGAMIWQRRSQLAYDKRQGYPRGVLWRALMYECGLLLLAGCSIGAVFGLYGQLLLSHALLSVTGFPVVFSVGLLVALQSVALVSVAAAAIVAWPGYLAAGVPPSVEPG